MREFIEPTENGDHTTDPSLPAAEHPWAKFAGIWKDDPLFDEWQAAIEEYRRQRDEEDDLPTATPDDEAHPLAEFAGDLKDHPLLAEWKQAMAEYGREQEREISSG